MILGLRSGTIELVSHDPQWEEAYQGEKQRIEALIHDKIIGIEHIGSTAIKTICAKPIIDMAISLRKYEDGFECIQPLESIGYLYKGESGIPGRHYFKTNDEIVKYHLHMLKISSEEWQNHILFRDYLNENPADAKKYEELKLRFMKEYQGSRELYTEKKIPFCKSMIKKAKIFYCIPLQD